MLCGCRSSPLSRAQFHELQRDFPEITPKFFSTHGDRDRKTSLRDLGKTDFFTRAIDDALLTGEIRLALHSAKDLPDPLPKGLAIAAITRGVDSSDALVLHTDNPKTIATSSHHREAAVRSVYPDATFVDIRGTISERLAHKDVDGVVIAEAALIRLGLTHLHRIRLPHETTRYQGQLAIVVREEDQELMTRLAFLDTRPMHRTLHVGLSPNTFHFPVIKIVPRNIPIDTSPFTHIIFTSKSAIPLVTITDQTCIAVGTQTAKHLSNPLIATEETAEGVIALLKTLDLKDANVLWPHSSQSRPLISDYLTTANIQHTSIALYDPVPQVPYTPPNLAPFDEIVFTSPSTVHAFLQIYPTLPNTKLTPIGPVTEQTLSHL